MAQNLISTELSLDMLKTAQTKLTGIIESLQPHIKGLSKEEREVLNKMGDKSQAFAAKVQNYMNTHPQYIPAYIDMAEYQKDFSVPPALKPVHQLAQTLFEMLDDTMLAAGSDVMEVSNAYYNSVRHAATLGEGGAKAIYDDLKARYPARSRKVKPTE